jgi:L-lactate dehydrogenase complex protein LldG
MTSTNTSREIFLSRVRRALSRVPGTRRRGGCPSINGDRERATAIRGDVLRRTLEDRLALLDLLIERARITGMTVISCPGVNAATRAVVALVQHKSRGRDNSVEAVAWRHPLIDRLVLEPELSALAPAVRLNRAGLDRRSSLESARLQSRQEVTVSLFGITSAEWCLADTATLVSRTLVGRDRWMSIVPPVNIVVLPLDTLIANLTELYALLIGEAEVSEPSLTNYMSLISGPSTTRDIESIPVSGVHGPREVHIVVVV